MQSSLGSSGGNTANNIALQAMLMSGVDGSKSTVDQLIQIEVDRITQDYNQQRMEYQMEKSQELNDL